MKHSWQSVERSIAVGERSVVAGGVTDNGQLASHRRLARRLCLSSDFVGVVELGLVDLEPWQILQCWDVDHGPGVVDVIHDFAAPGWEQRESYESFHDWLPAAIDDLIAFDY